MQLAKRDNIITADQNDSATKILKKSVSKEDVGYEEDEESNVTSSKKRQRDDSSEDREEQTSAEVGEEPEMINGMDCVPYIVDGIDVVTKLLEQKAVDNYEAAFYDILDLSEEREYGSIKSRFPPTVWKKLRSAARIEMIKMNDEVKAWLVAFDDKTLKNIHQELHRLSARVLQTTPPLQNELRYIHRLYQSFADLWTQNPNQLFDKDMSEATQIVQAVSPMLKDLFQEKYQMKWGEIGLEASSIRRNQEVESSARRRPGQRTDAILSLRSHLGQELLVCEVSGAPYENDLEHFGDDKIKIQKGLKDMLNLVAKRAKHGNSDIFQKLKVFGIQVFGWKAYIYAMDIPHMYLYRFEQVATFRIPQSSADLLWMPDTIRVLLSLKVWVNQALENLEELFRSSVRFSLEGNRTPPSSPMGYVSKTLDTPHKPKKVKHPALT